MTTPRAFRAPYPYLCSLIKERGGGGRAGREVLSWSDHLSITPNNISSPRLTHKFFPILSRPVLYTCIRPASLECIVAARTQALAHPHPLYSALSSLCRHLIRPTHPSTTAHYRPLQATTGHCSPARRHESKPRPSLVSCLSRLCSRQTLSTSYNYRRIAPLYCLLGPGFPIDYNSHGLYRRRS